MVLKTISVQCNAHTTFMELQVLGSNRFARKKKNCNNFGSSRHCSRDERCSGKPRADRRREIIKRPSINDLQYKDASNFHKSTLSPLHTSISTMAEVILKRTGQKVRARSSYLLIILISCHADAAPWVSIVCYPATYDRLTFRVRFGLWKVNKRILSVIPVSG